MGGGLFAHRGKPGWHSGAVFEAPALVAGFDDFAMMGQAVEERGCHLRVAEFFGFRRRCTRLDLVDNWTGSVTPAERSLCSIFTVA